MKVLIFNGGGTSLTLKFRAIASIVATVGEGCEGFRKLT